MPSPGGEIVRWSRESSINSGALLQSLFFIGLFPLMSIVLCVALYFYLLIFAGYIWRSFMLVYTLWIVLDRSPAKGGYDWLWDHGITMALRKAVNPFPLHAALH